MKQKRIPIVYIITKLELGGAQKVCLSLFNGLQKQGYASHLISGKEGALAHTVHNNKQAILLPSMQREISFFALWAECKNFIQLIRSLKKLKKQHPHLSAHTHSTKAGIIGRWAAWIAGIETRIHTIHGYGFHEHQSWFAWTPIYCIELITSFITTHFICVSAHDAKIGMRLFPRFSRKHSIIRAGVDAEKFYTPATRLTTPSTNQPFIFGTISCFKPQKNLFDLLKAFKVVYRTDSRARLEIIGDGAQRKQIEEWITTHSLSHTITLHGWQHAIAPITKNWHTFALSSLWEGLPCAVIEARLQHLPIISYQTGGIPEVVLNHKNGFIVDQGDWIMLAERMKEIMQSQTLYKKMQQFPDQLEDFKNEQMIAQHISLYKQLLS